MNIRCVDEAFSELVMVSEQAQMSAVEARRSGAIVANQQVAPHYGPGNKAGVGNHSHGYYCCVYTTSFLFIPFFICFIKEMV